MPPRTLAFMIAASFIIMIYVATRVSGHGGLVRGDANTLPVMVDIDPSLMLLMGLSHGGYLGAKIATRDAEPGEPK